MIQGEWNYDIASAPPAPALIGMSWDRSQGGWWVAMGQREGNGWRVLGSARVEQPPVAWCTLSRKAAAE